MAAAQEKRDKNRIEDGPYYYRAERRISLRMGAFRNLFWLHEDGDGYAVYSLHQRMHACMHACMYVCMYVCCS